MYKSFLTFFTIFVILMVVFFSTVELNEANTIRRRNRLRNSIYQEFATSIYTTVMQTLSPLIFVL